MDSCYIHEDMFIERHKIYLRKLLHLSDFVNNFMILELFLALEPKTRQNIYLRFSLWLNSLTKKIKNKEFLCTKVCAAFCSIVTASF